MPLPPEVDEIREELARLYRDAQAAIDGRLEALAADPAELARRARLRSQLVDLSREVTNLAADLDAAARDWTSTRLPSVYGMGGEAAGEFGWAQADVEAVRQLATDTYSDLLSATRYMRRDVKALIREAARGEARAALLEGVTARRAGQQLARDLAARGVGAVRYKNGAVHGIGDYSDVVLRSKTAEAYNRGTLSSLRASGVAFVQVMDGAACGWTSHDDPDLANGSIRRLEDAAAHVIAHPRCARSFGGRPDVKSLNDAPRRIGAEEQQRQATEERQRARTQRAASAARQRRLERRRTRMARRS